MIAFQNFCGFHPEGFPGGTVVKKKKKKKKKKKHLPMQEMQEMWVWSLG